MIFGFDVFFSKIIFELRDEHSTIGTSKFAIDWVPLAYLRDHQWKETITKILQPNTNL